ncbi:MAG: phosphodiester glycosidase family protein [Paraburkholderia sp.]|uniref:phosphodiester glycosidase family protein n=2 Tax=Paraburkholderia sp. TaxID=1926495 RepID=UPI00120CE5A9|nr:MAG: phosphodiester glycosidase family protein [Paraburkholderia sp.]
MFLGGCGSDIAATAPETWTMPSTDAPLGPAGTRQSITSRPVTAGVTYYQIQRGALSPNDFWTVNIGFYPTQDAAQADADALNALGFDTRLDRSAGTDIKGDALGYYLSVGKFGTQDEATAHANQIAEATANKSNKFKPGVRNTALAGNGATGPWIINVLAIKPSQTTARLSFALPGGNNLGGTGETVSAAVSRLGAVAGINAGFFSNINPFRTPQSPQPPRSPVGTTVVDGKLVGTAAGGRPGVMITTTGAGHPKVTVLPKLTSSITVTDAQNSAIDVKSIDRPILGTVVNCGTPAEAPITTPQQDYVCTNFDDLVMYDALYLQGKSSNTLVNANYNGATYELVVDAAGTVVASHATLGSPAPKGGYVLQGLGKSAAWLERHAAVGTKLTRAEHVYSNGNEIALAPGMAIVEAGPTLSVANLLENAWAEGFSPTLSGIGNGDPASTSNNRWYDGWVVARNGRTAIGVSGDGTILLVEIDGRQPMVSLGTSIQETSAVMTWLGAASAINLDGGGSSNMVVNGATVGHPSDGSGERAVGGTLLIGANQ